MIHENLSINELEEYSSRVFDGYLWFSDKEKPDCFSQSLISFNDKLTELPFVVEGFLYSSGTVNEKNVSIHIKNMDAKYFISVFEWELNDLKDMHTVPAHRMEGGISGLKFVKYFKEVDDEINEGFKINMHACDIFAGFEK